MSSIAKMIELSADSEKSFEDALEAGIQRAETTLRNVRGIWIKDKEVLIKEGAPRVYRLHLKVTFRLD
ncbi:MAG: dodecin family protein [Desulfurivibrionaceae bacterium]|nr:dodecin family protein [Desulfurivibrionaceae bacterium]